MSDLHALLPDFPSINKYSALISGLETHRVSLSELLTLDAAEIGKRTRLPLLDLQRLCDEVRGQLLKTSAKPAPKLRLKRTSTLKGGDAEEEREGAGAPSTEPRRPLGLPGRISTLDPALDAALGGGFPVGVLSEVVGESGVGKTQLLLSLLIAVQLPPPRGLGRKALYIATEAPLATSRLTQIIRNNPDSLALRQHCSLQSIVTINVPDLEAQEHILTHQLPVQLSKAEQYGGPSGSFGLVVLDSVAANFRPFFGGQSMSNGPGAAGGAGAAAKEGDSAGNGGAKGSTSLAARGLELQRLGMLLRTLAQKHNLAVVVANQVADRFSDADGMAGSESGGGLMSLSQQWGGGSATRNIDGSARIPKRASSIAPSSAKRPRQEEPGAGIGGTSSASSVQQAQELLTSHSMPHDHALTLTQESPLVARSRKKQQTGDGEVAAAGRVAELDYSPAAPASPAVSAVPMSSQPEADTKDTTHHRLTACMLPPRPPPLAIETEPRMSEADPMPFPSSQYIPPSQFPPPPPAPPVLQLDHQQRWFTGWGDSTGSGGGGSRNKTPSLGIVWAIQLGMRVALIKAPRLGRSRRFPDERNYFPGPHDDDGARDNDEEEYDEDTEAERHNMGAPRLRHSWRRWLKVVFAPHVASTGATATATPTAAAASTPTPKKGKPSALAARVHRAVEFEITMGGLQALDS